MVVTRDEYDSWKESIVTKALLNRISKDVTLMQELLVHVSTEDLQELQGRCKASIQLLGIEYEDLL